MSDVKLYVYDLSRGLAKSMSLALTGKQIDGIWHTSIVVYGREIFFGQGILEARPGTTHHGQPQQIIDCGQTHIDEATFNEYLLSMQDVYTADVYHLIEKNCNHFTADVVGFLTGGTIPQWISSLPSEFLSTPFGQSMRPQIDAMFRRVTPNEHRVNGSHLPTPPACGSSTPAAANPFGANLLSAVAAQAQASGSTTSLPTPKLTPEAPPLTLVTSSAHFSSILSSTTAVVANFTNTPGCPPCRAIKPAYESIASNYTEQYAAHSVRFVEIELAQGEGNQLASRYGVTATPTFIFFKDGKKAEELRGASKRELEGKVEAFLEDCFPRHPHRKLYLPAIEGISIHPITSSTAPNYPALIGKLEGFAGSDKTQVDILKSRMVPVIQGSSTGQMGTISDSQLNDTVIGWTGASNNLLGSLKPEQTFPIIDLWRIALLVPRLSAVIAVQLSPESPSPEPISPILTLASNTIKESTTSTSKPFLLTVLRLLTNLLSVLPLANILLTTPSRSKTLGTMLEKTTYLVVESLLHPDGSVRKAAADVAVNLATWRHRVAKEQGRGAEDESEPEWSMEIISALLEAIERESDEEVAHRLLAALALLLYLSPSYMSETHDLLQVMEAKSKIEGKVKGYKKKEVKKLAEEITGKIC